MRKRRTTCGFVLLGATMLALLAAPPRAQAEVAVEGGIFASRGTSSAGGGFSLGILAVPVMPVHLDLSVAVAGNAGAAGTLDLRFGNGTTLGAGLGIGNLGASATSGILYDALLAQSIAPHTAIETRVYFGPRRSSTLFAGLRVSF